MSDHKPTRNSDPDTTNRQSTRRDDQEAPGNRASATTTEEEDRKRRSRYHAQTVSMTDFGSEHDDEGLDSRASGVGAGPAAAPELTRPDVPAATGPAGESGLPPSRPTTSATGVSTNTWSNVNPAKKSRKAHSNAATSVGSGAASRPQTAGSRTHVPSLTTHALFKPMSSQRLQAQRQQRGSTARRAPPVPDLPLPTSNYGKGSLDDEATPKSRDTDATGFGDRTTTNPSPEVAETVRSQGESVAPLHKPSGLQRLSVDRANRHLSGSGVATPNKSPRSFRSSFGLPGRRSKTNSGLHASVGHEKLSSAASSPRFPTPQAPTGAAGPATIQPRRQLGKNYEYFDGNTVFCWGGRLQNARDRPINVATGILALLPAGLFFGYSGPWLWLHVSPAIPIVFAYIFIICFSSFFHASVTDPGILPRNLHPHPPSGE